MERETKNITIAAHEFKVKTYVNAREKNTIQQAYFKGSKVEIIGEAPKFSDFNPNVQYEVKVEMIRQLVVEMDASPDRIVERCEDLPADDFEELITALDDIASKKKS